MVTDLLALALDFALAHASSICGIFPQLNKERQLCSLYEKSKNKANILMGLLEYY